MINIFRVLQPKPVNPRTKLLFASRRELFNPATPFPGFVGFLVTVFLVLTAQVLDVKVVS